MLNGQITYGDVSAIVLILGITAVVLLAGVLLAVVMLGMKK